MERIEPTRKVALGVWWALLWRGALGFGVCQFLLGMLLALPAQALELGPAAVYRLALLIGLPLAFLVFVEATYRVLKKRFRDFEIAILRS